MIWCYVGFFGFSVGSLLVQADCDTLAKTLHLLGIAFVLVKMGCDTPKRNW